ncbi:MAG: aminotransferase [Rhodobacteraceae bacterium]|nr:aminotransferase [Paracoccaceae bacterium]
MNFDTVINRRGTNSSKWDKMEKLYGVSNKTGISMWVADMDFNPPSCIQEALKKYTDHAVYGYYGDDRAYREAICWWQKNRHDWSIDPHWIFSTHGLVNGTALCIDAFTNPNEGVVLFTPIYHSFFKILKASNRPVTQCPLQLENGRYKLNFNLYDKLMTGQEKLLVLCSPHNPSGRVWQLNELREIIDFAKRHSLIIISDEIHQDIVLPGYKHTPLALVDSEIEDRLIMMNAPTKTFNIAGSHNGNVIIPNSDLRDIFQNRMLALGMSPNSFGMIMTQAGYCPEGAAWVDTLISYLDENRRLFEEAINCLPGISAMPLEATYLSWVDFTGTGLSKDGILNRVYRDAQIAANDGDTFGLGGTGHLRFNLATQRSNVNEAIERLSKSFSDLH